MDYKKKIIKRINSLSGSRSPYEVFCDWVKCCALSIQNSCDILGGEVWEKREKEYFQTIERYEALESIFGDVWTAD